MHSSRIMNYEDVPGFAEKAYLDSAHAAVVNSVLHSLYHQKLLFSPGSRSAYCNSNYFLLGMIIEKVTGISYKEFLTNRILLPLKMYKTRINEMSAVIPGRVAGYAGRFHQLTNADRLGMGLVFCGRKHCVKPA